MTRKLREFLSLRQGHPLKFERESQSGGLDLDRLRLRVREKRRSLRYGTGSGSDRVLRDVRKSSGVASEVINGKRAISKNQAKALAEFFRVSPELFI